MEDDLDAELEFVVDAPDRCDDKDKDPLHDVVRVAVLECEIETLRENDGLDETDKVVERVTDDVVDGVLDSLLVGITVLDLLSVVELDGCDEGDRENDADLCREIVR